MKKLAITILVATSASFFTSCISNEKVALGGAPAWIAGGAKLDDEPEPFKPDPALLEFEEEGGPVELKIITDKRDYKKPPQKVASTKPASDPLESGRDYRIKRLFN